MPPLRTGKPRGRPSKGAPPRGLRIQVYVNEAEYQQIAALAEEEGAPSVSTYIRQKILGRQRGQRMAQNEAEESVG